MRLFLLLFLSCLLPTPFIQAAETTAPEKPSFPKYLLIDLTTQKAKLFDTKRVVWESTVSTGRESKETPTGTYKITDKYEKWVSTLYNVPMPHFQRFSYGTVGIHAGIIPGFPASHGCIRLPAEKAEQLFGLTEVGLPVVITGEAPPFEYFKARILQAKRDKNSPYSRRGTATKINTLSYASTSPAAKP